MSNIPRSKLDGLLTKKDSLSGKVSNFMGAVALTLPLLLGGCGEGASEKNYASSHDVESTLKNGLKDYSSNKGITFNMDSVGKSELIKMEKLSHEIAIGLSSIGDLDKKAIFIDIDSATGVVTNEALKKVGYNTTLNYYLNWSDNENGKDVVSYDRLFSVVSQYPLTKEDDHQLKKEDSGYNTRPWAIMLDYDRLPYSGSDLENRNPDNTFFNMYGLTDNDLPNRDIFKGDEKVRSGAVLVTYSGGINEDLRQYLQKLHDEGVSVETIFIKNGHVEGVTQEQLGKYESELNKIQPNQNNTNQVSSGGGHHGGVFVYPYRLYGTNYDYTNRSSNIGTSNAPVSSKFSSNYTSSVPSKGTGVFSGLNSSSSRLSTVVSSSRISGARGGIG